MKRCLLIAITVGLCGLSPLAAQPPTVTAEQAECFPDMANGIANVRVKPEVGGATVRLYFRWDEHGDMYWVDMVAAGGGEYWGIPAKPEPMNERIEYYAAVLDPYGRVLARSETVFSPVKEDCVVLLTDRQLGAANNLTIGETVAAQEGNKILGFLCDGVVTRVSSDGVPRPDEICRRCIIPWWTKEEFIGAAAAVGAAIPIISHPPPEPSPSRP